MGLLVLCVYVRHAAPKASFWIVWLERIVSTVSTFHGMYQEVTSHGLHISCVRLLACWMTVFS